MQSTNGTIEISPALGEVIAELNRPQTAAALKNLARNAELLDALVNALDGFLRRSEQIAENVGEGLREFAPATNGNGDGRATSAALLEEMPELWQNLPTLARTGNKLSALAGTEEFDAVLSKENLVFIKNWIDQLNEPATKDALQQLIDNAGTLAFLATAVGGFLARSEEIVENIGESVREFAPQLSGEATAHLGEIVAQVPRLLPPLVENLPALTDNLPSLMRTGVKVGEIAESEGVQAFLNSGMLTPELVALLGQTGKTAVETEAEFRRHPKTVSLFGLYRESKDEDVQRGLGFLLALAKNFGKMLKD